MKSWNEIRKTATALSKRRKGAYDSSSRDVSVSSNGTTLATYGNLLAERSVHVASGIAFDETQYRSAMDHSFRVTQHFMDALGRATNTVTRTCRWPGVATNATWSCEGWQSAETVEYPCGTSDYEVATDARGLATTTVREAFDDRDVVATWNGYVSNVVTTVHGGGTVSREERADGTWRETATLADCDENGLRVETTEEEARKLGEYIRNGCKDAPSKPKETNDTKGVRSSAPTKPIDNPSGMKLGPADGNPTVRIEGRGR